MSMDLTPGLSLRVTANDVRTWTVFYRDQHGRQKRLTLGRFPSVSLADARELAREAQRKVAKGGDPVVEKRTAREVLTFGELAESYIENHAKPTKRSWAEDERQLNADLLPKWQTRPAVEVTPGDLLAVLNAKLRAGAPVAANRVRALVSRIYTFGAEQRLVSATANPVIGVKKPTKEMTRDRDLTEDEIRRLWEACATQNPYVSAWFRLRLVTAQRGASCSRCVGPISIPNRASGRSRASSLRKPTSWLLQSGMVRRARRRTSAGTICAGRPRASWPAAVSRGLSLVGF